MPNQHSPDFQNQKSVHPADEGKTTMKLPIWIIAVSFVVGAIFIGYGIIDNRDVDLWPPKIHAKKEMLSTIIKDSSIKYIKNFNDIVEEASKVITLADSELWIAVDVPAYGAITVPAEFRIYEASLLHASARKEVDKKIIWLAPKVENSYNRRVFGLNDDELKYQDENGAQIRKSFPDAVNSDLAVLAFNNFWLSKDKEGQYHSVVTWFAADPVRSSQLVGIYTNAPDMATLLQNVWHKWNTQSKSNFSSALNKMYLP